MILSRAVSTVWSGLSAAAREGTRRGWLTSVKLEGAGKVVSVGNLLAGGAGKTPLVIQIAREAAERKISVCILCRGYGGQWENSGGVIPPGKEIVDPALCGDEAALVHGLAPEAFIAVGANRAAQFEVARKAVPGGSFGLVVLDDGFQHHRIRRDLNVIALTSDTSREKVFRDRPSALKYADLVVWTKGDVRPDPMGKPLVKVRYRLGNGADSKPLWLVTGVADGEFVERTAREAGYRVERHISFADHARYSPSEVRRIILAAAATGCEVAVTGKDWVKWRSPAVGVRQGEVKVLEPVLVFEEGRELWSRAFWGA